MGLRDSDGSLIQEGVCYAAENLEAFLSVPPICDTYFERLWDELSNSPFDNHEDCDMTLSETWRQFPAGTEREDIWHWFDERHTKGVYALLYGEANH